MVIDFQKLMSGMSDEGLQEYIDKRGDFTPEAVEAAIAELQKRGRVFQDEQLAGMRQEFQKKREAALKLPDEPWAWGKRWKKNVVTDENAPEYYSERAIYIFSVLFSMLFGAVLSAINFSKNEDNKGVIEVLGFGVCYTSFEIWLLSRLSGHAGFGLPLNLAGALILQFFWKKHIGEDTKYRAKPIGKPLIVSVIITVLLILVALNGGTEN
jgi:hypothetical protein